MMDRYSIYINNLIDFIKTKNIISIKNSDIPDIGEKNREILGPMYYIEKAIKYYNKYGRIEKPIQYDIDDKSYIKYEALGGYRIAKGTCFAIKNNLDIVNFYKVTQKYSNETDITFRFGTSVDSFTDIGRIIKNIEMYTRKEIICISLLSPCNTVSCKTLSVVSKPLSGIPVFKKALNSTLEGSVINSEQDPYKSKFHSIIFPLSTKVFKSGIVEFSVFNYDNKLFKKDNAEIFNIYKLIDISTGKSIFESIVNIAAYYKLQLKDRYILSYHCKSGKDRTSVYDAITQATFYYISKHNTINYKEIRILSQKFLIFGFIIAFYSTGVTGLKLKNIPVAKYIFKDSKKLYKKFLGHANLVYYL